MSTFTVTTECGTTREFESRRDAEAGVETHRDLCDECDEDDVHVRVTDDRTAGTGPRSGNGHAAGPRSGNGVHGARTGTGTGGDPRAGNGDAPESAAESGDLPDASTATGGLPDDLPGSVRTDPLDIVPGYMITEVEGQPTINKRGYAVIANHFDIAVESEAITTAGETDHEYAEFKATAWKKDEGRDRGYTGHATARASEDRRGIENNLNEMAETRAMKRAVAWASGVGLLAYEEMAGYLDEE